ncbi:MAG: DUF1569 domain-containing protein [Bacteroidota bacterium]
MPDFFDRAVADDLLARIDRLTPETEPQWGKMNVAQMLAHCSKPFEAVYDEEYLRQNPKPNAVLRFVLRVLAKSAVVGDKPYKRNGSTAPSFIVADERDFEAERARLKAFIEQAHGESAAAYDGRESHSFGVLSAREWSTLFHKHTDHHLTQFGV